MTCKYCVPEINAKADEPQCDENGEQYMKCSIDCLPIRGRLQRLVYESIFDESEYSEIVRRVQRFDPKIAQGNISRAISNLKKLGYVYEGENFDTSKRIICTAVAYKSGDLDESMYKEKFITISAKELRYLIFWYLSRRPIDIEKFILTDKDLIRLISFITDYYDDGGGLCYQSAYELMEPLVKKARYVVSTMSDQSIKCPDSLGKYLGLDGWEGKRLKPIKKQKQRGAGWLVYLPYFIAEWEELRNVQTVSSMVKKVIAAREAHDNHWAEEYRKDGMTYTDY